MSKFSVGQTEIQLDYSVTTPQNNDADIEQKSIITGKRHFIARKNYTDYDVALYLWKYSDAYEMQEMLSGYENSIVKFAPYNEDYVRDSYGDKVDYYFESVTKYMLDNTDRYPVLILVFKAADGHIDAAAVVRGYGHNYGYNYGGGF